MPVEQRSGGSQVRAIVAGVVAVGVAVAGLWAFVAWAGRGDGPVQLRLGDDVFIAGQAERLSAQVAAEGPLLFSDVSGRGQVQPIYVAHFGDDPATQWSADGSSGSDGTALRTFPWRIDAEGSLVVDLRSPG